jgi:O-antigen ligase
VGVNLIITVLTASRMPSAAAMAAVSIILFSGLRSAVVRLAIAVYGAVAVAGFVVVFGEQLVKRFDSESTSGREQLWGVLKGWLERYPWTGVGFGHHGLLVPEQLSRYLGTVAAHNEYLRVSVELGYIGAVAFLLLLLAILGRIAMDPRNANRLAFVGVSALYLVNSYTDNTLYATYSFMILVAGFIGVANAVPLVRRDPDWHPKAMRGTPGATAMRRDFNQPGSIVHALKRPLAQRGRPLEQGVNKP